MGSAATDGASDRHADLLAEHLIRDNTLELMEYLECGPEGIPSNQQLVRMGDNNNTQSIADYLAQLLKDKKQLAAFPNVFIHMERLLDDEIGKVRGNLFQINGYVKEPLILPEGSGPPVIHSEKVYVPVKEHPDVSILILFYLSNILFFLIFFIIKQYNLSLVIFIAFFQDAAIYVYFKYYRYCPSEIPNVDFF